MNATNSAQVDVEYVTPGIVYMARKHRGLHGYLYRVWYPIRLEESWGNSQNFLTFRSRLYTQRSQNGSSWLHTQLWFYFIDYLLTIAHLNFVQFYVIVLNILYDIIWYYMILYDIIWYYMILYDIIWYYMILYDIIWYYDHLWSPQPWLSEFALNLAYPMAMAFSSGEADSEAARIHSCHLPLGCWSTSR